MDNIPAKLRDALMPFQAEGVRAALKFGGRCLIGDEMGLGKTLQGLSVACAYRDHWPLLIVVPSSMRWVGCRPATLPAHLPMILNPKPRALRPHLILLRLSSTAAMGRRAGKAAGRHPPPLGHQRSERRQEHGGGGETRDSCHIRPAAQQGHPRAGAEAGLPGRHLRRVPLPQRARLAEDPGGGAPAQGGEARRAPERDPCPGASH
mmetsp:Transcript_20202/g.64275  ORF Transcript_20202/g.64275 Transcript_20202/m.64275 type:complete len:206 (+) Transcript_20202:126-743(+)